MEAFEQFVALAMESEGLVVSGALKFPVAIRTKKTSRIEVQTHGYEVDLVGARQGKLVLATVKSFFGSRGVVADEVSGKSQMGSNRYALLNNLEIRNGVLQGASERFGYRTEHIELRLYVGKFAGSENELRVREWCASQIVGSGPIQVVDAPTVVDVVRKVAATNQYRDNAVLATIKVMEAAGKIGK